MKQLILMEGLPGTGKTTTSKWLAQELEQRGERITLLLEDDLDSRLPCSFFEIAGMPIHAFEELCAQHPQCAGILRKCALQTGGYYFLSVHAHPDAHEGLLRWDMGDEYNLHLTLEDYMPCALAWLTHCMQIMQYDEGITIMDSAFMQNPINELLFRKATEEQVLFFMHESAKRFAILHPICIYLYRKSAKEAIDFAKRVKGDGWAQGVDRLEQTISQDHFKRRFALEKKLLSLEIMPCIDCEVIKDDWAPAHDRILRHILTSSL